MLKLNCFTDLLEFFRSWREIDYTKLEKTGGTVVNVDEFKFLCFNNDNYTVWVVYNWKIYGELFNLEIVNQKYSKIKRKSRKNE